MNEIRIKEGFPNQRLVVMPSNVITRCLALPMVSQLYVTDLGSFPTAPHHYVERKEGVPQAILNYCLHGKGGLQINGMEYSIQQGHAMIIPPGTPHLYHSDEDDPWAVFWVHFDGAQTETVLKSLDIHAKNPVLYVPDTDRIQQAFEDLYACLNYHFSDAGLLAMTSELLRLLSRLKLHQGFVTPQRQSAENRVMDTIPFMEQHLDLSLTLNDLSVHSGQSIPYYSKLFKERTNQSPMNYYIQLKIRKACALLDQTDFTIRQIAESLGYDDPYYFSRLFKKIQGHSPTAYRQTVKG